jgi:hypothetical protein
MRRERDDVDREKVIRSLETAVKNFERYSGDEYGREYDYARVEVETLEDALALLKAQGEEIAFLKHMQRQMVRGIDNQTLGEMVERAVKWE